MKIKLPKEHPIASAHTAAPPDRRADVAAAVEYLTHRVVGPSLEGYASPEVAALIVLGIPPHEQAPELTRAEAHTWAHQTQHADPVQWLLRTVTDRGTTDSIEVVRWLQGVLADPARRTAASRVDPVWGDETGGTLVDRLDELRPCDLVDGVRETLTRAVARQTRELWDGPDELRPREPWMDQIPDCTVLTTFSALFDEGRRMRHCIANYAADVASGRSVILSILGRSTAEYRRGQLYQHVGPCNGTPPRECVEIASRIEREGLVR